MSIVDEIYDGLTDDEALMALPSRLAALTGARSCTLEVFAPDNRLLAGVESGYFSQEMNDFYIAERMYRYDYWRPGFERAGATHRAISAERVVDPSGYETSIFYNEFYRRYGDDTGRVMGAVTPMRSGVFILSQHRGLPSEAFSEADEQTIQPLLRHLARVFHVRMSMLNSAIRAGAAEDVLDGWRQAVFVVDAAGRPVFANRQGEVLLVPDGPLTLRDGRLRARHPAADSRLVELVAGAARGRETHGGAMTLPLDEFRSRRVVVAPWRSGGKTRVVVMIDDPNELAPSSAARLSGLYGLTAAEAKTVVALAQGLSPAEAAQARGVSVATIRTQIHQARAKSGARSVTDLVRLAASLPRVATRSGDAGRPRPVASWNRVDRCG